MKKVLSLLLALCLFAAVPFWAGAKGINRYQGVLEQLIRERIQIGSNHGLYYDINGDGLEELMVIRTVRNQKYEGIYDRAASLYAIEDGEAVPLMQDEYLFTDVAGPKGYMAVVEKDGAVYLALRGESGATSGPMMRRSGWWKLYQIDEGGALQVRQAVEYNYCVPGNHAEIDPNLSGAAIDGASVSYPQYEEWVNSLSVKATLGWSDKNPSSFEKLLKQAKADTTGDLPTNSVGGFKDVKVGTYYAEAVQWAVDNQVAKGITETAFKPESTCDRGQIVTFLWRSQGSPEPESTQNPFTDVSPSDYYYKAVLWASEKGVTQGSDSTHFDPGGSCDRAQAVTFLWRAHGEPDFTRGGPFGDVESQAYYSDAVQWAVEKGVTSGTGGGNFSPHTPCSRGQIVTFLYRAK